MEKLIKNIFKSINIIYLIFSLITCFSITIMLTTGTFGLQPFAKVGKVYDLSTKKIQESLTEWSYDDEENRYYIPNNSSIERFKLSKQLNNWNFCYIDLDDLSKENIEGEFVYFNNDNPVNSEKFSLNLGKNIVKLKSDIPFNRIGILILNAEGEYLSINSIQMRDSVLRYTNEKFVRNFFCIFFLINILFLFLKYFYKQLKLKMNYDYYCLIDNIQYVFILFFNDFPNFINRYILKRNINKIRVSLFSLLFTYMIIANIKGISLNMDFYRFHVLIISTVIIFISLISIESNLKKIKWNQLGGTWVVFSVFMCLSDLFIEKDYPFTGYVFIIVFGFLIFVWNQMNEPEIIIDNIISALKILYPISVIYCLLFREKKLAVLYNGLFSSPEEFAIYSLLMVCVFTTEIDSAIRDNKNTGAYLKNIVGVLCAYYFILRAGFIPSVVGATIAIVALMIKALFFFAHKKCIISNIIFKCVKSLFIGAIIVMGIHIGTKSLPIVFNLSIQYENDVFETNKPKEIVQALNSEMPEVLEGVQHKDDLELSIIQKTYFRNIGIIGNSHKAKVFGKETPAYSGYIEIAYKYGVFALGAYILFQLYCICFGLYKYVQSTKKNKAYKRGRDYDFLVFIISIAFVCNCIYGNIEYPFNSLLWLLFYLLPGYWFCIKINK